MDRSFAYSSCVHHVSGLISAVPFLCRMISRYQSNNRWAVADMLSIRGNRDAQCGGHMAVVYTSSDGSAINTFARRLRGMSRLCQRLQQNMT